VVPASGVPGRCFVLSDTPGKVPASFGAAQVVEQEEEEEPELEVKGDVDFHQVGRGRCRGPHWTTKKWPVIKGSLSAKDCALACAKKRGCSSFDIGPMGEDQEECALYGHKVTRAFRASCTVSCECPNTTVLMESKSIIDLINYLNYSLISPAYSCFNPYNFHLLFLFFFLLFFYILL
jgi:hypothetical protein